MGTGKFPKCFGQRGLLPTAMGELRLADMIQIVDARKEKYNKAYCEKKAHVVHASLATSIHASSQILTGALRSK